MKVLFFLGAVLLTATASFGRAPEAALLAKNELPTAEAAAPHASVAMVASVTARPESPALFGQDKPQDRRDRAGRPRKEASDQDQPKKEKDDEGKKGSNTARETQEDGQGRGQAIKEVATAKRQSKPEKVSGEVDHSLRGSAARPQSAARPVRGAATGAVKAAGNAAKAVRPVKVGGAVGVGKVIKAGKN